MMPVISVHAERQGAVDDEVLTSLAQFIELLDVFAHFAARIVDDVNLRKRRSRD